MGIYQKFGLMLIINASGAVTRLGGAPMGERNPPGLLRSGPRDRATGAGPDRSSPLNLDAESAKIVDERIREELI